MSTTQPKKRTTTYIAAAVLIIIILAGVGYYMTTTSPGPPVVTTTTSAASSAVYKDTIIIGTTDSVATTLDPADAYDYFAQSVIMTNIANGLVEYRPGSTDIVPALATDWKVSSDGMTWTFNLRQGVKFADGTPFDASVVKYTVDREFSVQPIEAEGPFAGVGLTDIINKTVVTGPYQVQFVLNAPFSAFLSNVAFQAMFPVNPKVAPMNAINNYTGNVNTEINTNIGAYMLTGWQRTAGKDIEIDLTANPNYWNASSGYPKTKNIVFKFYTDSASLNLALQSGAIDIAYRQLTPTDIRSYGSNSNFKVWQGPGAFIQYLVFNEKVPPFDKVAVRKAFAAAMDRSLITNTVFLGQVVPLYSMIPAGMAYHTDAFKVYGDGNVSYAQSLLQSAGFSTSNPLKFTLDYPTGHYASTDGIASAIKQALEKTGMIQVTLRTAPWATYRPSVKAEQLQVFIYGWYPDYVDPFDYTKPFLPSDGIGFLHTHYVSPAMSKLLDTAETTTDASTFPMTYGAIQQLMATDVPTVPLFQGTLIAVSNPKVGGMVLDTTTWFRAYLLWETT